MTGVIKKFKIVISKHDDGYVGYPLGLEGVVVGQGETYDAALLDTKSAIQFHVATFGPQAIKAIELPQEAFLVDAEVPIA